MSFGYSARAVRGSGSNTSSSYSTYSTTPKEEPIIAIKKEPITNETFILSIVASSAIGLSRLVRDDNKIIIKELKFDSILKKYDVNEGDEITKVNDQDIANEQSADDVLKSIRQFRENSTTTPLKLHIKKLSKIVREDLETGIIKLTIITSSNLGINLTLDKDMNASISNISDNSILQTAGIQLGDIITRINYFTIEKLDSKAALTDVIRTLNEKKTNSSKNIQSPLQLYIRQTKPTAEPEPQATGGKSRKTKRHRHRKKSRRNKKTHRNKH